MTLSSGVDAPRLEELTDRVEHLLRAADSRAAEELVQTLVTIYGEGLRRILSAVNASGDASAVVERICADPFLASLLIVHDLHPVPLETRIERALDKARPYIHSHGGKVELVGYEQGIVEVRMSGTCEGCPASSATMKLNIEREIRQAAPEVLEVRALS